MIGRVLKLSSRDYFHEWQMSSCFVLALAAILGPMMVLFGLKYGIVGGMLDELIEDPRNREIRPVSSGRYDPEWFGTLQSRDDVAFAVPRTRSIAATIELNSENSGRILPVEVVPSAKNDPLLQANDAAVEGYDKVILSRSTADKLNVDIGQRISGSLARQFRDRKQRVHLAMTVVAIAPPNAFARDGVFVSVELMTALEDYRDGRAVEALRWQGNTAMANNERSYPGFRLYTSSIYDVSPLTRELNDSGVLVRNRAEDIELVRRMDATLSSIYWAIAIIGLVGFSLSLGASLWANVDRKRKELSIMRLVGFRTGDIIWFPVLQAALTGFFGWLLACIIYLAAASTINSLMAEQLEADQQVATLLTEHYLISMGLSIGCAMLAAGLAGLRSAKIEPSDGLREI